MVFLRRSLDSNELHRRIALAYLLNLIYKLWNCIGGKIDSKVSVIVDNFYVVPIDMKAMFIKSRVDFLYFFSKIIILIFFGLPDKSQCSQYSERMDSKSCSRVLYQQNSGYDKVLLFSQSQWGPWFQRKGLGKESTVTYNERWTDRQSENHPECSDTLYT